MAFVLFEKLVLNFEHANEILRRISSALQYTFQGLKKILCSSLGQEDFLAGQVHLLSQWGRFQAINSLNKLLSNKDGQELVVGKQNDWVASKRTS